MRRLSILVLAVVTALGVWAEGNRERATGEPEPVTLLLAQPGGLGGIVDDANAWLADKPGVTVRWLGIDINTGGNESMLAYVAAGVRPLINDFMGRAGQFADARYALDLAPYIDRSQWYPWALDAVSKGDAIYALPESMSAMGFFVNIDIMEAAGIDWQSFEDGWTIAELLTALRQVKARVPDVYPTYIYAKSQNADYLYMQWFASFNAKVYETGVYDRCVFDSPEAVAAMTFLKTLYDEGLIPEEAPALDAGDELAAVGMGKVAALPIFPGWPEGQMQPKVNAKLLAEQARYKFVPFPKAPGVESVQHAVQYWAVVAPRSDYIRRGAKKAEPKDDRLDRLYAELAVIVNTWQQVNAMVPGGSAAPARKDISQSLEINPLRPHVTEDYLIVARDFAEAGVFDLGLSQSWFSAARPQMFPILQKLWAGDLTPAEAAKTYTANVNAVLARFK